MTAEAIVQKQLDAYNKRSIEAFLKTYSSDAELYNFPDMKKLAIGASEIREVYSKLFSDNPNLHCEIKNRMVIGSFVIDQEKVTGFTNRTDLHAVAVYLVDVEVITKVWLLKEE